jgi:hypothetical protein
VSDGYTRHMWSTLVFCLEQMPSSSETIHDVGAGGAPKSGSAGAGLDRQGGGSGVLHGTADAGTPPAIWGAPCQVTPHPC